MNKTLKSECYKMDITMWFDSFVPHVSYKEALPRNMG